MFTGNSETQEEISKVSVIGFSGGHLGINMIMLPVPRCKFNERHLLDRT